MDLTTVGTTSATFHDGVDVTVLDGLRPDTAQTHAGIAFRTLRRPHGDLRCRFATVNDVHFGEEEAGRIGDSQLGPILRADPDQVAYPELMNRAAVAEMTDRDRADGLAAVIVKGDLSSTGASDELAAFEACYRPPFGDRLHAVRGNHDCPDGQADYAGDTWIALDGVAVALLDTAVPGGAHGDLAPGQLEWLDDRAAESHDPVIVMGHHPQHLGDGDDPGALLTEEASAALDAVARRRPAIVAYTSGHTHRHRVRRSAAGIPTIEVGCVKDFPGSWAEYEVYDGGIVQVVHRISTLEALRWSERCRGLYADFGLDYAAYALGGIADRCLVIPLRT